MNFVKRAISCSSSAWFQTVVNAAQVLLQSTLMDPSPMDIEQVQTSALTTNSTSNPPKTLTDSSLMAASSIGTLEASTVTATLTSTVISTPPHSPHQQQQHAALLMQTTPPHHNCSPATMKNKIYFNLFITPAPLPTGTKAMVMMKLEAYHQSFLKVIDALIHVNKSLAFWPF